MDKGGSKAVSLPLMTTFADLGLIPELQRALEDLGFENPTPVQEKSLQVLLNQKTDLVSLAQTGTGKTAAFGLPLLQNLDPKTRHIQGLILSPTRELCLQIGREMEKYALQLPQLKITAVFGGANIDTQAKVLKKGVHILVATPGRLQDLIRRRLVRLNQLEVCVLDEADEMLNMGFFEDVKNILKHTPEEKSTWLFSATMPKEIRSLANELMHDPVEIAVGQKNIAAKGIAHELYETTSRNRYATLRRLVDLEPQIFGCVFCRTKRETQKIAERLIEDGYQAAALHGDLSQNQRELVMAAFRNRNLQLLVATDVAARGIDVDSITHVIHYQLPDEPEVYTHRSGRTGRAGKKGKSLVIATSNDRMKCTRIEKQNQIRLEKKSIPGQAAVGKARLNEWLESFQEIGSEPSLEAYYQQAFEGLKEVSKEDIIRRLVNQQLARFAQQAQHFDLNEKGTVEKLPKKKNKDGLRFQINLGERDNYTWGAVKDLIIGLTNLGGDDIYHVDTYRNYSLFTAAPEHQDQVFDAFQDLSIDNRAIQVSLSTSKKGKKPKGDIQGFRKKYKKRR